MIGISLIPEFYVGPSMSCIVYATDCNINYHPKQTFRLMGVTGTHLLLFLQADYETSSPIVLLLHTTFLTKLEQNFTERLPTIPVEI